MSVRPFLEGVLDRICGGRKRARRGTRTPIGALPSQAHYLFAIAKHAYQRTTGLPPRSFIRHDDPITAVIFAALAAEAYINEAGALAVMRAATSPRVTPSSVGQWGKQWEEAENDRLSAEAKFNIAAEVFTGRPYAMGQNPYQPFALLMKVRDAIAHLKSLDHVPITADGRMQEMPDGRFRIVRHPILDQLRSQNVTDPELLDTGNPWLDHVSTPAAAQWACEVTSAMVRSFVDVLPAGSQYKLQHEMSFLFMGTWDPDAGPAGHTQAKNE